MHWWLFTQLWRCFWIILYFLAFGIIWKHDIASPFNAMFIPVYRGTGTRFDAIKAKFRLGLEKDTVSCVCVGRFGTFFKKFYWVCLSCLGFVPFQIAANGPQSTTIQNPNATVSANKKGFIACDYKMGRLLM